MDKEREEHIGAVYRHYAALIEEAGEAGDLRGVFLWAGALEESAPALLRAANMLGAASLATARDLEAARRAQQTGVADFVVTAADEALRIVQSAVRRRQRVAVAVVVPPAALREAMAAAALWPALCAAAAFVPEGARRIEGQVWRAGERLYGWEIPAVWSRRTAEFDAELQAACGDLGGEQRGWLRQSPRWLGREARRWRTLVCDEATAARLEVWMEAAARGAITRRPS